MTSVRRVAFLDVWARIRSEVTVSPAKLARPMRDPSPCIPTNARGQAVLPDSMTARCFCCDQKLYFAPDSDAGRVIERYGIVVCATCFESSASGWSAEHEPRVLQQLQLSRLAPPARNAHGLLPRD
jgi:hypothetical protein